VLVEFGSAVNAVQCAVELQHRMAAANADLPETRRIVLRVGVNLGDVLVEGSDLYGDGVNIPARLEGIAEPGGVLISGTAFDHVRNKVNAGFEDLGSQILKNIAEPIRVYRVAGMPRVPVATPRVAPDKPSIAVLPFVNMSGDPRAYRYKPIEADPFFARAIELDPGYAQAYARRSMALVGRYWHDRRAETMQQAVDHAQKALSLDDGDALNHVAMGYVLAHGGQLDLAGPHFDRAIALNPNDVRVASMRAWWLNRMGQADEALEGLDIAMRRDPFPPNWFWEVRGQALLQARRCEEAIDSLSRMSDFHAWNHAYLAACHAYLNHEAEARAAATEARRMDSHFTVSGYGQLEWFKTRDDLEHLLNGMRKAGLPE
jgi:hypothetical protein